MTPTPKMLSPLVKEWAKNAFVVSFKVGIGFGYFLKRILE